MFPSQCLWWSTCQKRKRPLWSVLGKPIACGAGSGACRRFSACWWECRCGESGWVCLPALPALWSGAGAVLAHFGNWLCLAAVLLAVFAAAIKAAVPSVPLRTLLRPRTILLVLALTLGLGLVDLIVPMVWGEEPPLFQFFWWGGATCLLAALCGSAYRYYGKRFCGKEAELSERTEIERAALRLADGVTPRR